MQQKGNSEKREKGFRVHATQGSRMFFAVACILMGLVLGYRAAGFSLVVTPEPSLGRHFFICLKERVRQEDLHVADLVEFPLPVETPYYRKGTPFLKKVMCLPGQYLRVDENRNFYCGGYLIGTALETDKDGNPVGYFRFDGKVPEGKVFVMGTHRRSYDSRYWGFVDIEDIEGRCYGLGR